MLTRMTKYSFISTDIWTTLTAVIACAEKSAKIRKAEEKAKTNMLTKQKFSIDSNGKLANCESKNPAGM